MAFENFAALFGKAMSNDRAYVDQMRRTLEAEINEAVNQRFSALNSGGSSAQATPATPATDPSVLSRLGAVEQALQDMGAKFKDIGSFEADTAASFSADDQDSKTNHDRLTAIETALSDMTGVLTSAAEPLTALPDTSVMPSGSSDTSGSASSGTPASTDTGTGAAPASTPADGSATNGAGGPAGSGAAGFDPVAGGADAVSPTGLAPAFGTVEGGVATTAAPVEIAPGTGQFVDPHATNPAAVATGAPAPISGSAGQPGGDTSAVVADAAPNASEAGRSAPQPTAANIAAPGAFDPVAARANPAPFANTEQDAPKSPVINAVPGKVDTGPEVSVSANTSTAAGVGQAGPGDPVAAS